MNRLALVVIFVSVSLLFNGCGNDEYALSKQDLAAFKAATPEMKQLWEQGLKADRADDYLAAGNSYRALLTNNITPDQLVALQTALGGLNLRLNDAAAKKALDALKESSLRR